MPGAVGGATMIVMSAASPIRAPLPRFAGAVDVEPPILGPAPDPEFGSYRAGPLIGGLDGQPEAYQRLLANPFLGFVYLTGWLAAMYETVAIGIAGPLTPMLLAVLVAGLWLVPHLMQYHCLDCGGTGRLLRWRKHVCHRAMERYDAGRPRRFRGPSPPLQVVLWLWGLLLGALLVNALRGMATLAT